MGMIAQPTVKDFQYLSWTVAGASIFSTCKKRQYMSIIVDKYGYVVGTGYNGVPAGFKHCVDGGCPRALEESVPGSDYSNCLSNHSEHNAITNSSRQDRLDGTLYVNGEPCFTCAKAICNSGVSKIVYTTDTEYVYDDWYKSEEILEQAGIEVVWIDKEDLT
jgi:dCMP deaminase